MSERPRLTPKQEAFALAYVETGNASEAYRRAYDAEGMLPATINRNALVLTRHNMIAARVAALRAPAVRKLGLTRERVLRGLLTIAEDQEAPHAARVAAWRELGPEAEDEPVLLRRPEIDARQVHINLPEGTTLDDLRQLRDELRDATGYGG
jgi:hypothetical protein